MNNIEIIIILLSIISLLALISNKINIPYPILLVLAGLAIGFIPHLPKVILNPDVVFLIFLPPLLYASAWTTSWHDFKAARRPISLLATGLVLFTTTLVAFVAHTFIPGFSWPVAFLLGSIISPPDAVAAASITKGLGLPKRVITVLEGESLVNDASGLIAYRYALTAVMTGNFIFWQAGLTFLLVATAGILLGYLVGLALYWLHNQIQNPTVETSLTFLTPFIAFLIAEQFHVSGVLAVVTCGLYLSWRSSELFSPNTRLQALSVWNVVVFILNGIIFILIGLQLPFILEGIKEHSLITLAGYGLLISITAIVVRILWVFPGAYIPRFLFASIRKAEPETNWKVVSVVAWTGMRGVVSLAAALALPEMIDDHTPFPQRDLILFLTFSVILITLIFQGLTLPKLIKLLGVRSYTYAVENEIKARIKLASAAIEYIEENISYGTVSDQVLGQIKNKYELRISHLSKSLQEEEEGYDDNFEQFHELQGKLLNVERAILADMHKKGAADEEILRKLEYELDLEESKLGLEKGEEMTV